LKTNPGHATTHLVHQKRMMYPFATSRT
jgi:hypothetical protein